MSWALLEWRLSAPGLGMTHTPFSNCRFAKKAHMGQSKVNVQKPWLEKAVFFRLEKPWIPEKPRCSGMPHVI
jgi:hypothetical protein